MLLKVWRWAQSEINPEVIKESTDWKFDPYEYGYVNDADVLAEGPGRACYQSWGRPNPATRENSDYIRNAVHERGHESIVAHATITYYVTGVSRALTHELIRSRFLAFSQLSQRYVSGDAFHMTIHPHAEGDEFAESVYRDVFAYSMGAYLRLVKHFEAKGLKRKEAREAARQVLPEGTSTDITITGNIRAWRDFLNQRWSVHADAEIRQLAGEILKDLRLVAPNSVADIPEEPYR